jgi:hypothetical protein
MDLPLSRPATLQELSPGGRHLRSASLEFAPTASYTVQIIPLVPDPVREALPLSRIFITLSAVPVIMLVVTMTLGWWIGDYNGPYQRLRAAAAPSPDATAPVTSAPGPGPAVAAQLEALQVPRQRFRWHFLMAVATALATILANSISVTYLIGTCRWVTEVSDAYGLGDELVRRSTRLKRRTFPWSLAGMLAVLTIVALGAASDPGTLREDTARWVLPHLVAALAGACLIIWAFLVQGMNLHMNAQIIDQVLLEVRRHRESRAAG